ncbi:MAG: aminotransferase class IV [Coriobacteriia bacterium]|nr:aminotransferase class IV [Coriobacteriia bacterium]
MNPTGHVYLNGRILPASQAAISPFDVGILRGYAVFDLFQTINGEPFQLEDHLARFRASADMLGLTVPADDAEITAVVHELLTLNGYPEAIVRLVLTGGESADGMHFDPKTPTFFIITHELFEVPETAYVNGTRLLTKEHRREVPEAKTTNYITWLRNHDLIERNGAIDLLYHADGLVSEAATASFYVVRDGKIHAPDAGVLPGTVGRMVMQRAASRFEVVYGPLTLEDTLSADEAFITSSVRGVVPIVQIDDHTIGDGRVGAITKALMDICREEMRG